MLVPQWSLFQAMLDCPVPILDGNAGKDAIALGIHFSIEPLYWPTTGQWGAIVLMGIGPFTLANISWDKATRAGSAATISSLAFLTPLVAMTLLVVFELVAVTTVTVIGACLAILGAILSAGS